MDMYYCLGSSRREGLIGTRPRVLTCIGASLVAMAHASHVQLASSSSYLIECWTWYVLGMLIILLRYAVRLRTVGLRGFEGDDYVAFIVRCILSHSWLLGMNLVDKLTMK